MMSKEAKIKLLVVDDDKNHCNALVTLISDWGYAAQGVYDGESAVALCREQPFDLIQIAQIGRLVDRGATAQQRHEQPGQQPSEFHRPFHMPSFAGARHPEGRPAGIRPKTNWVRWGNMPKRHLPKVKTRLKPHHVTVNAGSSVRMARGTRPARDSVRPPSRIAGFFPGY